MNAKLKAIPFFLCFTLSSCVLIGSEKPVPFPNLLIYQGATRFRFGYEPEQFILSVPDGNGGRDSIKQIFSTFYNRKGTLYYACELESKPEKYYIYEYDFVSEESRFRTEIVTCNSCPKPGFYEMANDFSPHFVVADEDGKPRHAFFDKNDQIVAIPDGFSPFWVGEEGYALTNWYNYADEKNYFHYYDGTEVPFDGVRESFACYGDCFIYRSKKGTLCKYEKATGEIEEYKGWKPFRVDRYLPSTFDPSFKPEADWSRMWYRSEEGTPRKLLVLNATKEGIDNPSSYIFPDNTCFSEVIGLGQSHFVYVEGCSEPFLLDLKKEEADEIRLLYTLVVSKTFEDVEYPVYSSDRYQIIETFSCNKSACAISVFDKQTNRRTFVQQMDKNKLMYQRIEEVD